jgi:HTH-type transcriptional regulator / antitoxin HigA
MRPWTIIQNSTQYKEVTDRIETLSVHPPKPNSDEGKELLLLGYLADRYETEKFPINYPDPIEAIKVRMEELNLKPADLLEAFGDKGTASKVLKGNRPLSLNMIRYLSERLALPASLLIKPISNPKKTKLTFAKRPAKTKRSDRATKIKS